MSQENFYDPALFVPSLTEAIRESGAEPIYTRPWTVPIALDEAEKPILVEPELILINAFDEKKFIFWKISSLPSLFRGDAKPPSLERYPEKYVPFFTTIEYNIYSLGTLLEIPPTDREMREIYSAIRRKPDGPVRGINHDHVRKSCALALATHPWSRHEFEAVLARLEKSCRTFAIGPVSRNYFSYVKSLFK